MTIANQLDILKILVSDKRRPDTRLHGMVLFADQFPAALALQDAGVVQVVHHNKTPIAVGRRDADAWVEAGAMPLILSISTDTDGLTWVEAHNESAIDDNATAVFRAIAPKVVR